jgi:peptidoglycan/xylan/chitin deacetylase (PgdA/CDA1 family)
VSVHRSFRRPVAWLPLVAAMVAGACSENALTTSPTPGETQQEVPAAEVRTVAPPVTGNLHSSAPALATCAPAVTYQLTDGRRIVGKVTVANDAQNLIVTYAATSPDWYISDTRLAVAKSLLSIPQDNNHLPLPWQFPYSGVHQPVVGSYTYSVALSTLGVNPGDDVVVAAMAGVVHPKNGKDYAGAWEWLVMWGIGNIQGRSLETLHNFTVARCANQPPPVQSTSGGMVTITFDDGWKTTYDNAYPVLKQLGLKGNVAVNPDPVDGGWSAYMTLANVRELYNAGWSVVSHTMSHRDLTTLSDADLDHELRDSKAWVEKNGFGPTNVFIVPFHSWGDRERTAVAKYYKYVRGYTVNQFWPARFAKVPITTPMDLTAFEPEYAPFTTPEGRTATMDYVKRAVKEGEFVDLMFHQITPAQLPDFRTLMTEVAAYKANVRTWAEVAK